MFVGVLLLFCSENERPPCLFMYCVDICFCGGENHSKSIKIYVSVAFGDRCKTIPYVDRNLLSVYLGCAFTNKELRALYIVSAEIKMDVLVVFSGLLKET